MTFVTSVTTASNTVFERLRILIENTASTVGTAIDRFAERLGLAHKHDMERFRDAIRKARYEAEGDSRRLAVVRGKDARLAKSIALLLVERHASAPMRADRPRAVTRAPTGWIATARSRRHRRRRRRA